MKNIKNTINMIIIGIYIKIKINEQITVAILFHNIFAFAWKLSFVVIKSDVHKHTNFYVLLFLCIFYYIYYYILRLISISFYFYLSYILYLLYLIIF